MDVVRETVGGLIKAGWQAHVFALVISLFVLATALLDSVSALSELAATEDDARELAVLYRYAEENAGLLREILVADYSEASSEAAALRLLISETLQSRRLMSVISNEIAEARWPTADERVAFNKNANWLGALFLLNFPPDESFPMVPDEPRLGLAETAVGTFKWQDRVADLQIEDLARLTYLASLRPARIRELHSEGVSRYFDQAVYDRVQEWMNDSRSLCSNPWHRHIRTAAERLWVKWNDIARHHPRIGEEVSDASLREIATILSSLASERDNLTLQITGRAQVSLPGIEKPFELRLIIILLPMLLGLLHVWSATQFIQAKEYMKLLDETEKAWATTKSPLFFCGPRLSRWSYALMRLIALALVLGVPLLSVAIIAVGNTTVTKFGEYRSPVFWIFLGGLVFQTVALLFLTRSVYGVRRSLDKSKCSHVSAPQAPTPRISRRS